MSDLESLVERRITELLGEDKSDPPCPVCGRKPITPAQMTGAIRAALQYLQIKAPPPSAAVGSGFKEGDEDE